MGFFARLAASVLDLLGLRTALLPTSLTFWAANYRLGGFTW